MPRRKPAVKKNLKNTAVATVKVPKKEVPNEKSMRRKLNANCKKLRVVPAMPLERCPLRTLSSIPARFQRLLLGLDALEFLKNLKTQKQLRP